MVNELLRYLKRQRHFKSPRLLSLSRHVAILLVAIGSCCSASAIRAQSHFDGPIRIVVPYQPGSAIDVVLRTIGQKIAEQGGPTLVIEDKPGGAGVVGAMAVKQAPADGKTLFLCDLGTFAINKTFIADLSYDPVTDFKPITPLWSFPSILVVPADLKANSVAELIELAKHTPGGLSYGSQGVASSGHIRGAVFAKVSGAPLVHVPYKGPTAVNDLVAGRIALYMTSYLSVRPQLDAKSLKVLAASAPKRLKVLPDIPTMGELGYPEVDIETWFGLAAPAGTPDGVVQELNRIFVKAASAPDIVEKLAADGIPTMSSAPNAFADLIKADIARLKPIVESLPKEKE